ncbi:molybdopterin-dependent oxidoreductase [Gemmobacter fulvus]|uniref:molybdopterin-dependent oxidoreductase n=1 Tax=Gemmobacter fulvus TaxID=2840474 RepID=UPI002796C6B3|nr:molybdopterin cofactor-binding domain-containing protein [Gemmobacter fulvus]MDQ1847001.1 molybdopterin-dependent oxidoreductase [Gemmobacter fulvus]
MTGFTLNGHPARLTVNPTRRLSDVLREEAALTGTKVGCDAGDCGACTVLLDGQPVCACLTPAARAEGRSITTIEASDPILDALRHSFLRHGAAQCGICTPGMLLTATALLRQNPAPTRAEAEAALGGVLCRCTGYAAILTAVCTALAPDPMAKLTGAVGEAIPRLDGAAKVAGDLFGADLWQAGGLVLRAIRAPHPHAAFRFGDLAGWAAEHRALVFTAADIPGRNAFGVIPAFADQPALATSPTRFQGEAVALLAFEDLGPTPDLSSFPIEWQPLPPLLDLALAEAADAPQLHPDRPGNRLIEGRVIKGDADAALTKAAFTVSGRMDTAFVEHAYIEPEAGSAWMEGETLCIRACTQAPVMDRDEVAAILALPPDRVRILPSAVGGGFGSKLDVSLQPLLGLVALKTGRPVRMTYGRAESMASTTKRHPGQMRATLGCDAEGTLVGMTFDGSFNTGAYASWGPTVANRVPVHASGPYRMPALHAKARAIHTHGPVSGAFRGFGVPQATLLQETLLDQLAEAAGMDRLALRLHNALRAGDATATGQRIAAPGIHACLTALVPHWQRALTEATPHPTLKRGVGIAACWYGCGNTSLPNPSTIRLGLTPQGALVLHQGATDIGQGSNTVIAQIAAQALGLPLAAFQLIGPDTALTPDAGKTSASRQTYVSGRAALAAGAALRAEILRRLNMGDGARLSLADSVLTATEGGQTASLALDPLPTNAFGYALMAEEGYDPPTAPLDAAGQGTPYAVYGFGAQMVELEVDITLGTTRLIRITAAHDVGRAINPTLARGQIEGGIAQGIGLALMEEYLPGRTDNLHDYLIPTTGDVPPITSLLIEVPDPEGPFGAKGLGEHTLIPTAPAILNAIRHATGVVLTQVPALPHRLRAALREAGP